MAGPAEQLLQVEVDRFSYCETTFPVTIDTSGGSCRQVDAYLEVCTADVTDERAVGTAETVVSRIGVMHLTVHQLLGMSVRPVRIVVLGDQAFDAVSPVGIRPKADGATLGTTIILRARSSIRQKSMAFVLRHELVHAALSGRLCTTRLMEEGIAYHVAWRSAHLPGAVSALTSETQAARWELEDLAALRVGYALRTRTLAQLVTELGRCGTDCDPWQVLDGHALDSVVAWFEAGFGPQVRLQDLQADRCRLTTWADPWLPPDDAVLTLLRCADASGEYHPEAPARAKP